MGTVFYVFPTFSQGRRIIWDAIQNDGMRILDYIPKELVESRNEQQMRIRFVNGSVLQIIGSDNYDNTLVGTNPMGVIFSEFALTDPRAYQFVRPILTANGGWCFIQSTPRGRNSFWELFKIAQDNPKSWFSYIKTVEDTKHISVEEIRKEIDSGEISEDLAMQEYWCFPESQQVLLKDEVKNISEVRKEDMVISHTGRPRKVLDTIAREYEGLMIEISSFGSSENIVCTPNHPIRVYNKGNQSYEWKEAKYITEDDKLVFPKMQFGQYKIISYELCMLLAWYITEGSCFNNGVQFTVKKDESYIIGKYLTDIGVTWDSYDRGSKTDVVVNSTQLVDFFKSNCGLIAYNKRIPFSLISGFEDEFFHELMKGDGCHNISKGHEKYSYTTVSKTLAYQVQLLANSLPLGYAAGISVRDSYEGNFQGRTINCRESYQVNVSFSGLRDSWLSRTKYGIAAKVKSVNSYQFKGIVYNLKVQYDESYLVGGRSVHNCSFDMGVEGSYYAKYIDKMRLEGRIDYVAWEPAFPVHTAWDIGVRDSTSIIFFQSIGTSVRIIDYYEKSKEGLEHYVKLVKDKPYLYGKHIAPHDIAVKEFGSGMTRLEKAMNLGIDFTISSKLSIEDGIEAVRSNLPKVFIDKIKCDRVIKALENYRQEFDAKKKVYKQTPLHNEWSHCADAMRYLCVSLSKVKDGMSQEDVLKMKRQAEMGSQAHLPDFFRTNISF